MSSGERSSYDVPPPVPPDGGAWYAPGVCEQYEVHPGVVVTIRERRDGFSYEVREPGLTTAGRRALRRIHEHFDGVDLRRPLTRDGAAERMAGGFEPKYERVIERLVSVSPAARRRVDYHALVDMRCLGRLTPPALDGEVQVADIGGDRLVVHTTNYAPATIDVDDPAYVERFASERVARYTVPFHGFDVPVVLYHERVLGSDPFETKYAVIEPDRLPGDEALVEECKERVWETSVAGVVEDRATFVRDRAETLLARRLTARNTRAWVESFRYRVRSALAAYGLAVPPVGRRYAPDRLADLVYYVLRDYVGYGQLTIPIRDDRLEDVEANRVGERVKVIPRGLGGERVPSNLSFDDESVFVNVVTQLAAADGVELNASTPSAKVNIDPDGVNETIRCAVALPTISEDGPHISIRKQAADPMTPVDLVAGEALSTELVALLWLLYEHNGVVLYSGPTGVGKTTLLNAHMPFIPYEARPVTIDEGSREVRMPHETGISLTTRDHEESFKRVTMADLMTEANYLNPDVEVIAEINTAASFETFGESLNTGHGILGTTHAEDVEKLVNRFIEQGLAAYLLREIDLVVFPRHVDGQRYVREVVELLAEEEYRALVDSDGSGGVQGVSTGDPAASTPDPGASTPDPGASTPEHGGPNGEAGGPGETGRGVIRKDGATVYWNRVARRDHDGQFHLAYDHPELGDDERDLRTRVFHAIAGRTDRPLEAVEREFQRKHGYVQYLVRERVTDFETLFAFLADLRTDEAATVERIRRQSGWSRAVDAPADPGGTERKGAGDDDD